MSYLMGATGPVYRTDEAERLNWYVTDGLGSTVAEVDGEGGVIVARSFDVYGLARAYWLRGQQGRTPPDETSKHRFVGALGHTSEGETGLVYMRARYLDAETGRFVSEDPAMDGGNWFVYARNNPVCMVDAKGKVAIAAGAVAMIIVASIGIGFAFGYDDARNDWNAPNTGGNLLEYTSTALAGGITSGFVNVLLKYGGSGGTGYQAIAGMLGSSSLATGVAGLAILLGLVSASFLLGYEVGYITGSAVSEYQLNNQPLSRITG